MSHESDSKDLKESGKGQEDKLHLQNVFSFTDVLLPLNTVTEMKWNNPRSRKIENFGFC